MGHDQVVVRREVRDTALSCSDRESRHQLPQPAMPASVVLAFTPSTDGQVVTGAVSRSSVTGWAVQLCRQESLVESLCPTRRSAAGPHGSARPCDGAMQKHEERLHERSPCHEPKRSCRLEGEHLSLYRARYTTIGLPNRPRCRRWLSGLRSCPGRSARSLRAPVGRRRVRAISSRRSSWRNRYAEFARRASDIQARAWVSW